MITDRSGRWPASERAGIAIMVPTADPKEVQAWWLTLAVSAFLTGDAGRQRRQRTQYSRGWISPQPALTPTRKGV